MTADFSPAIESLRGREGRLPVSVIITTFNEEINVSECVQSVLWADEILLVDSFSTDGTVELARHFPIKIEQREYFGSAAQKNWAMDQVRYDWVLIVDADERIPESLAKEILEILCSEPPVNGYYIARENVFVDKVIRHSGWSTDKVIRLFRKAKGRYPNRRVHADVELEGRAPTMKNAFLHYTFRSFDQYFDKFLNYAEWGAAQAFREGRSSGVVEILVRPVWRFFRGYVVQLGFLDGLHGLVLCLLMAFGVFIKYARLWEYRVRTAMGEELQLPAFDDDPSTWTISESPDVETNEDFAPGSRGRPTPPGGS